MELRLIDFLVANKTNTSNNKARPPLTEYAIFRKIEQITTKLQACLQ